MHSFDVMPTGGPTQSSGLITQTPCDAREGCLIRFGQTERGNVAWDGFSGFSQCRRQSSAADEHLSTSLGIKFLLRVVWQP